MSTAVAHLSLQRSNSLSPEAIGQLAGTFQDAGQAVWIYDAAGRCVYHNPPARRTAPDEAQESVQDIYDYRNQRVGALRIRTS